MRAYIYVSGFRGEWRRRSEVSRRQHWNINIRGTKFLRDDAREKKREERRGIKPEGVSARALYIIRNVGIRFSYYTLIYVDR